MFPPTPTHLDSPRASVRVVCEVKPVLDRPHLHTLDLRIILSRPWTGEKARSIAELIDLLTRAAHEQELFPPADWELIQWATSFYRDDPPEEELLSLSGVDLLRWLCRWGACGRLELDTMPGTGTRIVVHVPVPTGETTA